MPLAVVLKRTHKWREQQGSSWIFCLRSERAWQQVGLNLGKLWERIQQYKNIWPFQRQTSSGVVSDAQICSMLLPIDWQSMTSRLHALAPRKFQWNECHLLCNDSSLRPQHKILTSPAEKNWRSSTSDSKKPWVFDDHDWITSLPSFCILSGRFLNLDMCMSPLIHMVTIRDNLLQDFSHPPIKFMNWLVWMLLLGLNANELLE